MLSVRAGGCGGNPRGPEPVPAMRPRGRAVPHLMWERCQMRTMPLRSGKWEQSPRPLRGRRWSTPRSPVGGERPRRVRPPTPSATVSSQSPAIAPAQARSRPSSGHPASSTRARTVTGTGGLPVAAPAVMLGTRPRPALHTDAVPAAGCPRWEHGPVWLPWRCRQGSHVRTQPRGGGVGARASALPTRSAWSGRCLAAQRVAGSRESARSSSAPANR